MFTDHTGQIMNDLANAAPIYTVNDSTPQVPLPRLDEIVVDSRAVDCTEIRDHGRLAGYVIRVKMGWIVYEPGVKRSLLKTGLYLSKEEAIASFA